MERYCAARGAPFLVVRVTQSETSECPSTLTPHIGMPSPGAYPTVTVQLPLWPGLSGVAALGPVLDPSAVPQAAASLAGGGGAALFAMPSRDGAPAMRGQSLAPPGPPGKGALEEAAAAADWDASGEMLAVGYRSGGVFVWSKIIVEEG